MPNLFDTTALSPCSPTIKTPLRKTPLLQPILLKELFDKLSIKCEEKEIKIFCIKEQFEFLNSGNLAIQENIKKNLIDFFIKKFLENVPPEASSRKYTIGDVTRFQTVIDEINTLFSQYTVLIQSPISDMNRSPIQQTEEQSKTTISIFAAKAPRTSVAALTLKPTPAYEPVDIPGKNTP